MTTIDDLPAGDPLWMLSPELACESPIETAFLRALVGCAKAYNLTTVAVVGERRCAEQCVVFMGEILDKSEAQVTQSIDLAIAQNRLKESSSE